MMLIFFILQSCAVKLFGGESTDEDAAPVTDPNPYFVGAVSGEFYVRVKNIVTNVECDGILIGANYALVKPSCLGSNPNDSDIRIYAGETFGGGVGGGGTAEQPASNHFPHPNYSSETLAYNIMILQMNPILVNAGVIEYYDMDSIEGLARFSALNSVRDWITSETGL